VSFCTTQAIHLLITDKHARDLPELATLQAAGVKVLVA
jgi:hypothetical protein